MYTPAQLDRLKQQYQSTLLDNVIPFWLKHGMDRVHGGIMTAVDRDGTVIDTDKAMWFQGRAGWMFSTLYNTVARKPAWLKAAKSCVTFARDHGFDPRGKMYFTVTREGQPLRMRRYVYSECFATIAFAAYHVATGEAAARKDSLRTYGTFLRYSHKPGYIEPKTDPKTRPMKGLAPLMITLVTSQEIRSLLGDVKVEGRTCTGWIDRAIEEIERDFYKPKLGALMECVGPRGEIIDHLDGRMLNPGHAIECAWFILHEARLRKDRSMEKLGLAILDGMWARGWDREFGGLFYFRDIYGHPVAEYWQDMKFWWPHNEAIIATLLAYRMTGRAKYARMHQQVHDWSFRHFADRTHGEWYGYLRRDGVPANSLKGSMWKGPFHLPRMLWYCWKLLES